MPVAAVALVVLAALVLGYRTYGRYVARALAIDPTRETPAVTQADGVDHVPTRPFYLLGQHVSAIAAAGPIVGPIVACGQFGWLPCVLWITLGVIFVGAVHDFSSLVASIRHRARSIAEIARQGLGRRAWGGLMAYIWLALVYVIVAFTDVTASTFVGRIEELQGVEVGFERGGAVAFASLAYLLVALVMGVVERKLKPPLWLLTVVFVPATLAVVWLGTRFSTLLVLDATSPARTWSVLILGYCLVASLMPVWLLLQPRGYLGGFVLYLVLAVGAVGVLVGGFTVAAPAFRGFEVGGPTGSLFPFLFVTIACGACSGFHGLVCSGTTSKQVASEAHCRPVGYGGMLIEGLVALIALTTVMIAVPAAGTPPGAVYGQGIGRYLTVLIGEEHLLFAIVFGSMAFSTFVFDTLDVATRLGRYILQELFGWQGRAGAVAATLLTVGAPLALLLSAPPPAPGRPPAYMAFWTLFGTSNQLLAGLTLLAVTIWLRRSGRPWWLTFAPMLFVLPNTVWALLRQATGLLGESAMGRMNGAVAVLLLALAAVFVVEAARAWRATAGGAPLREATGAPGRAARAGSRPGARCRRRRGRRSGWRSHPAGGPRPGA